MGGPIASACWSERLGQVCLTEELGSAHQKTSTDWLFASGNAVPAGADTGFFPKLRIVLHPGRIRGISDDSSPAQRNPDSDCPANFHDHRSNLRVLLQPESDAAASGFHPSRR